MSEYVFPSQQFLDAVANTPLAPWADALSDAVIKQDHALKHGHLSHWEAAVEALPAASQLSEGHIKNGVVTLTGFDDTLDTNTLCNALQALQPWRKGPYRFGPVTIDTEWRSDWKWDRLTPHISPLAHRVVLDVGCGSGYHLWRMRDAGASQVLGIDPSLLYLQQFNAAQRYYNDPAVQFLPLPLEKLPAPMQVFDTVFSMGVLYHRRDPLVHLRELQQTMSSGAELVLETLIIPGDEDDGLALEGRYANMRNIYELPTIKRLERWLQEAGFTSVRTVSRNTTSRSEQRTTEWMSSHSLAQALNPGNANETIEGHPRPLRAIVIGENH